jgi:hypothetical protein
MTNDNLFKNVLDTRNLEVKLFWERSNYLLVLNSAIIIAYFTKTLNTPPLLLPIIGLLSSLLWFCLCAGSKYWQSYWEQCLTVISEAYYKDNNICQNINFYAFKKDQIKEYVRSSIINGEHGWYWRWLDKIILWKFSVSIIMMLISLLFVITWVVIIVLVYKGYIKNSLTTG